MNGPVTQTWDPSLFEWHEDLPDRFTQKEMAIIVRPDGSIRILAGAGELLLANTEPGQDGYRRVAVGLAPKAIAIRPMPPGKGGFRLCKATKTTAAHINCRKLMKRIGWPLPVRMLAVWDDEHKMLVGKLPQEDKPDFRTCKKVAGGGNDGE